MIVLLIILVALLVAVIKLGREANKESWYDIQEKREGRRYTGEEEYPHQKEDIYR